MATRFALCFLLISHYALCQFPVSPNKLDENGKRTGHWTILFDSTFQKEVKNPDSAVYYRLIRYEAGKPVGKVRDFYRSGQKQWDGYVVSFNPDIVEGEANHYYENGQVRYKLNYRNGKLNGPFQEFNTHGVLIADGFMKNDSSSGHWIYYNDDGIRYQEKNFKGGAENGLSIEYYLNGNVKRKGLKRNNLDEGYWESFYENGSVHTKCDYKNDKRSGKFEWYNEQGKLEQKGQYVNGKEVGNWVNYFEDGVTLLSHGEIDSLGRQKQWEFFFSNGKKKSEALYVNDQKEGTSTYYHESGGIQSQGMCHHNLNEGEWKYYYEDGKLNQKVFFSHDTIHGPSIEYFQNGQIKAEGVKVRGLKDGVWKFYFENGNLDAVEEVKRGELHGRLTNYYPDGKIKDSCRYVNGQHEGLYTSFHPNGMKNAEGAYHNNQRNGVWKWYYPNGQLWSKYSYVNGTYEGPYENYHANGIKKEFGFGKNGMRNGLITYWYENGNVKETGNYENGLAEGRWVYFDSLTKKKTKEDNYIHGKPNGKAIFYDSRGKVESVSYYINGFWEEAYSIRDSVERLINEKQFDKALKGVAWLERVLKRDHFLNNKRAAIPPSLYNEISYRQKDYTSALKWGKIQLDLEKKYEGDTSHNYFVAVNDLANVYDALGNHEEAIKLLDQAIAFYSKENDFTNLIIALYNKANAFSKAGKPEQGEQLLLNNVNEQVRTKGKDHMDVWRSRQLLGVFYGEIVHDYSKAIEVLIALHTDVERSKKEDKRSKEIAESTIKSIADSYQSMRQRKGAIPWYKLSIAFAEKNGITNFRSYLDSHSRLAYSYFVTGQPDSSLWTYQKMIRFITENHLQNTLAYAEALAGQAELYFDDYLNDEALRLWLESAAVLKKIDLTVSITYANVLSGLAQIYALKGDYLKAEQAYTEGARVKKEDSGEGSPQYLGMLNGLGDLYREMGQYDKARKVLQESEKLILQYLGKDCHEYAECMQMTGDVFYDQYKYKEAIEYNGRSFDYFKANVANKPTDYADALSSQSKYYRSLGDFVSAEKLMKESLQAIAQNMGEENTTYLSYRYSLATLYSKQGLYGDALRTFIDNLARYKKLVPESNVQFMHAVRAIGRCYFDQEEHAKAEPYYRQYRDLILKYRDEKNEDYFDAIYRLAEINFNLDRDKEAETLYRKVVLLSKSFYGEANSEYAFYQKELALFYFHTNKLPEAEEWMTQAVQSVVAALGKENVEYGNYLLDLALIKSARDKNKEAEELYLLAASLTGRDKESNLWSYVDVGKDLGGFYEKLGRYKEAEKLYLEITDLIQQRQGKKFNYARYRLQLVGLYYSAKKYELAKQEAATLIGYVEEEGFQTSWILLELHNILGLIASDERNLGEAESHFRYCIDMRKLSQQAVGYTDAIYLNNMALVKIYNGDFSSAEKLMNESFAIYKKLNIKLDPKMEAMTVDNYASLYQAWGKWDLAEKYWQEVTSKLLRYTSDNFYFMSDEEKAQFWNDIKSDFEYFNTFATIRSKQNPAILGSMYNNRLATKAILLSASNKIKNRILGSGDQSMIGQYYNWVDAREKLAQLYTLSEQELKSKRTELDSLQSVATKLEKDLNISSDDLDHDRGKTKTTWRDIQKVLSSDEAAIEIIRFRYYDRYLRDSVLYAALILTSETRQQPTLVILPNGGYLEGRAFKYYKNAIAARLDDKLSYQQFWGPIDVVIKNKRRIYLSLDGVYNQINVNTLRDPQGKFLVESRNFTTVSNTKDLLALKSNKAKRGSSATAALFGYPKYFLGKEELKEKLNKTDRAVETGVLSDENETGISELPGTLTEVDQVKEILTANHWQAYEYVDERATEKTIKSINYPAILHVATHGYFEDEDGNAAGVTIKTEKSFAKQDPMLRAGILLTGASNFIQNNIRLDNENGILTAYEAANLNLENTDLVVLSACETGRGQVQNGEGVYGLQRAFQAAGAQAIIMSLWKVDDEATQELMTSFYQNWMKGLSKADAFRAAQLDLKIKYSHPYFWGAFVMMGE